MAALESANDLIAKATPLCQFLLREAQRTPLEQDPLSEIHECIETVCVYRLVLCRFACGFSPCRFLCGQCSHCPDNQRFQRGHVHRDVKPFSAAPFCLEEGMDLLFDPLQI